MNDNQPTRGVPPIAPATLRRLLDQPASIAFDWRPPFILCDPPLTWLEKAVVAVACIPGLILGYMLARGLWDGTL